MEKRSDTRRIMQVEEFHTAKPRIEWIDLAKGLCICLVVIRHIACYYDVREFGSLFFVAFRMPLYYMLSGIFFKKYENFIGFLKRKVNKLLIPYLFFYIVVGFVLPLIAYKCLDWNLWTYQYRGWKGFFHLFTEKTNANSFVWFLWSLFQLNMLFYLITIVVDMIPKLNKPLGYGLLSFSIGTIGILFSICQIDIPCYLDTSFTVVPFFYVGWLLKNYTSILFDKVTKKNIFPILSVIIGIFFVFVLCGPSQICRFYTNEFGGLSGLLRVYPLGILGTIAVLLISKIIRFLPIVSYVGRYSIMILCTHVWIIPFSAWIVATMGLDQWLIALSGNYDLLIGVDTFLILIIYLALIPLFKRYLPYVTAQKDVVRIC